MMSKDEAIALLKAEAAAAGKTVEQWLQEDLKPVLDKAWEIQQRQGGKPVKVSKLVEELNNE